MDRKIAGILVEWTDKKGNVRQGIIRHQEEEVKAKINNEEKVVVTTWIAKPEGNEEVNVIVKADKLKLLGFQN